MKIESGGRPAPGDPPAIREQKQWRCKCGHLYEQHRHTNFHGACSVCDCASFVDGPASAELDPPAIRPEPQWLTRARELLNVRTSIHVGGPLHMLEMAVADYDKAFAFGQAHGRAERIEPLKRSDDPEQDEVFRMNVPAGYLLMAPEAYQMDMRVARAKEREACAKLAEQFNPPGSQIVGWNAAGKQLAAAIRDQKTK